MKPHALCVILVTLLATSTARASTINVRIVGVSGGGSFTSKAAMIQPGDSVTVGIFLDGLTNGLASFSGSIYSRGETYSNGTVWPVNPSPTDTVLNATGSVLLMDSRFNYLPSAGSLADAKSLTDPNDTDIDLVGMGGTQWTIAGQQPLVLGIGTTNQVYEIGTVTFTANSPVRGLPEQVVLNTYYTNAAGGAGGLVIKDFTGTSTDPTINTVSTTNLASASAIGQGVLITVGMPKPAAEAIVAVGAPEYDSISGNGMKSQGCYVNNNGTAVGSAEEYVGGVYKGQRTVRWDVSGSPGVELGSLGTDNNGLGNASISALNEAGTSVGGAYKYVNGVSIGPHAVRWDAAGTAATELGNLGTESGGYTESWARAVNNSGTAVGYARKWNDVGNVSSPAVRWDASGTAATELGNLGTASSGFTSAVAEAINDAGTAVGYAEKYVGGVYKGQRAVRWDVSGTAATELGNLGTDSSGVASAVAEAINDAGTAVGSAEKYVGDTDLGPRAVRWDAGGTMATELGNLGTSISGRTVCYPWGPYAVNGAGTTVGVAYKYVGGVYKGQRAVRWDASGTAATELGNLGTDSNGVTYSIASSVNEAGTAVGFADKCVGGMAVGLRAVIWLPDASAIDLNELGVVSKQGGGTWLLTSAANITADGWVSGNGTFEPDGAGPLAEYLRCWTAQVGLGGTWIKAGNGTWGRGPNWSTGTPAMQVGNATFDLSAAYTVALDRNENTRTIAINAGTVTLDFSGHTLSTESGLSIAAGAAIKGAGTIVSNITNAGHLLPGNSPGTLGITGNLASTGTLEFEIGGLALYDRIDLTGAFTAGGTIKIDLLGGYVPVGGEQFNLMNFGSFANSGYVFDFTDAPLPPYLMWDTSTFAPSGSITVVPIPEPSTLALLGVGAMGLLACEWRRWKGAVLSMPA
jgi:hypothetical protein